MGRDGGGGKGCGGGFLPLESKLWASKGLSGLVYLCGSLCGTAANQSGMAWRRTWGGEGEENEAGWR